MTALLQQAFATVSRLPDAQQDELARVPLQLVGVESAPCVLTPEEHADLADAEAEIARGEFATEDEVRALWAKYDPNVGLSHPPPSC